MSFRVVHYAFCAVYQEMRNDRQCMHSEIYALCYLMPPVKAIDDLNLNKIGDEDAQKAYF
jgi:hypothetical protein